MAGVQTEMLASHLDEFMWRERYGRTPDEALQAIFDHLADWYQV